MSVLDLALAATSLVLLVSLLVLAHVGWHNIAAPRPALPYRRSGRPLDRSAWLVMVRAGAGVP